MCAKVVHAWHHARAQGGQEEPAADSEQLLRGFAMCFLSAQALRESERAEVVASATGLLTPRKGSAAAAAASGEGGGADATPAILRQSLRWQEEAEQEEKGRLAAEREAAKAERLAQKQRERESAREAQAVREAAPRRHQEELAAQAELLALERLEKEVGDMREQYEEALKVVNAKKAREAEQQREEAEAQKKEEADKKAEAERKQHEKMQKRADALKKKADDRIDAKAAKEKRRGEKEPKPGLFSCMGARAGRPPPQVSPNNDLPVSAQ